MRLKILIFTAILLTLINGSTIMAQNIRPIRDNVGFCWTPDVMNKLMNYLKENSSVSDRQPNAIPVAGISPHDDYLYAGRVYYPLYKLIKAKEVVIFGVTHGTVRKAMNDPHDKVIFDNYSLWHGPFGNVAISELRDYIKHNIERDDFMISDKAQNIEHSIEAVVPFLQFYKRDIKITPIMITGMSYERMNKISGDIAVAISRYIKENNLTPGKDIFFLISTDANHYGKDFNNSPYGTDLEAHEKGIENDRRIAGETLNGMLTPAKIKLLIGELWPEEKKTSNAPLWCGKYSVPFGLMTTLKTINKTSEKKITGKLLKYSDTWTEGVIPVKHTTLGLTAPFSLEHWVGFLSAAFYLE